jgi:hypothetical protein
LDYDTNPFGKQTDTVKKSDEASVDDPLKTEPIGKKEEEKVIAPQVAVDVGSGIEETHRETEEIREKIESDAKKEKKESENSSGTRTSDIKGKDKQIAHNVGLQKKEKGETK